MDDVFGGDSMDLTEFVPPLTPEQSESRMIALAVAQAEAQLAAGTAPTQVVVHYLKLATERERLEREKLVREAEMMSAKADNLRSEQRAEELYAAALAAFTEYSPRSDEVV